MIRIHPPALQRMHDELQEAIRHHAEWHRHLVRTLVCRLPLEPDEVQPDAHLACAFGQWLYGHAQHDLRDRPEYASIEAAHHRLHDLAARLLVEARWHAAVSVGAFDEFVAESGRLRRELDALHREMAVALRSRDTLTGTYRRVELLPALCEARELVLRGVQSACIAFMDLDRFKAVNDGHGHGVGDVVLAHAARCVIGHLRPYDKVFRYGGDEFLLLLPGTLPEEAWHLVDRIRDGLAQTTLGTTPAGEPIRLTASFGISPLAGDASVEDCITRADKALLVAKASGRNRAVCFEGDSVSRVAV